jgi:hypothetical protein
MKPADSQQIFVTGMFRSGTTLIARMLNAHPRIAFASDPFAPLFRAFRNAVALRLFDKTRIDRKAPLDDYYFYEEKQRLMKEIQETPLTLAIGDLDLPDLQRQIIEGARPYSPAIAPLLEKMRGSTFVELFDHAYEIIRESYGDERSEMVGFKEVWTSEFASHLLRHFPRTRVVHVVRDPRAVCASKNVTEAKYPLLFLARQWRKLCAFAWRDLNDPIIGARTMLIRFEDLLADPEVCSRRLCAFMKIDFDPVLADPSRFTDGEGRPWRQNSSHFRGGQKFNPQSVDKWRQVLSEREIQFIEALCGPEMRQVGYTPDATAKSNWPMELIFKPPHIPETHLARWIIPYSPASMDQIVSEMGLERLRGMALEGREKVAREDKMRFCLSASLFDQLRNLCRKK